MSTTKQAQFEDNSSFLDSLTQGHEAPEMTKKAESYIRVKNRGKEVCSQVLPEEPISIAELDARSPDAWERGKFVELEPSSPGAYEFPLDGRPPQFHMRAKAIVARIGRMVTPRMCQHVDRLAAVPYDLQDFFSDVLYKYMGDATDNLFFSILDDMMGGSPGAASPHTGHVHWSQVETGIGRIWWKELKRAVQEGPGGWPAKTVVLNALTLIEMEKITHDEWGGPGSEKMLTDGFTAEEFDGLKIVKTIKSRFVPEGGRLRLRRHRRDRPQLHPGRP